MGIRSSILLGPFKLMKSETSKAWKCCLQEKIQTVVLFQSSPLPLKHPLLTTLFYNTRSSLMFLKSIKNAGCNRIAVCGVGVVLLLIFPLHNPSKSAESVRLDLVMFFFVKLINIFTFLLIRFVRNCSSRGCAASIKSRLFSLYFL